MINNIKTNIVVFLMAILSCSVAGMAHADLGVIPIDLQGGAIQTGSSSTNVSMDYEKVVLTYSKPETYENKSDSGEVLYTDTVMKVHVSAIFKMMNNGAKTETIDVFFPADTGDFARNITDESITNFKVNGRSITNKNSENVSMSLYGVEQKISAYQWTETFYPKKENQVKIEYDSMIYKEGGYNVYYLAYILGTGRTWQGSIKKGDIVFVLPEALSSYAVTSKPPQMQENKLPFTVKENTINLSFSNYEPDPDEMILIGVYDFEKVNEIEQLKKEQPTFSNTLKLAGLFRELSFGGHCVFCTGATAENAKNYYSLALDKASSKDEVNLVLGSFSYGFIDGKEENYSVQMNNLFDMLSFKNCDKNDFKCEADVYMSRDNLGDTPFGGFFSGYGEQPADSISVKIPNSDFLVKYADKMKSYDPDMSASVNNFLKEIPVAMKAYLESIATPEPTELPKLSERIDNNLNSPINQPDESKNSLLLIGLGVLVVFLTVYALFREFKKR